MHNINKDDGDSKTRSRKAIGEKKKIEIQCYGLTPEGQVLSRLCESKLSQSEAQIICDRLNNYLQDEARVEMIETP